MVFVSGEGFLGHNQGAEQKMVDTQRKKNHSKEHASEAGETEVRVQEALPH